MLFTTGNRLSPRRLAAEIRSVAAVFLAACAFPMLGCLPANSLAADAPQPLTNEQITRRIEPIFGNLQEFRKSAAVDPQRAIARFTTPAGAKKFAALGARVWGGGDRELGWSYFMTMAVTTFSGARAEMPLVAYYHPWSDVFLVTAWRIEEGRARIDDAEFMPGDWVRNKGRPPINVLPLWLRQEGYLPLALGEAVAQSVRSFEDIFTEWTGPDWRSRLGMTQSDKAAREINNAAAAAMLYSMLKHATEFSVPSQSERTELSELRLSAALVMEKLTQGRIDEALTMLPGTLPETRTALSNMPAAIFGRMIFVASFAGKENGTVFLSPASASDYAFSITFRRTAEGYEPRRADLIYYPAIYGYWVEKTGAREGGAR